MNWKDFVEKKEARKFLKTMTKLVVFPGFGVTAGNYDSQIEFARGLLAMMTHHL